MNSRLQLYAQTVRNGESHQSLFNGGLAARGLIDVRIGTLFTLPQPFDQLITMVSLSADGSYLYVIQPLTSRIGDYKALVLFVPRQLLITAATDIPVLHSELEAVLHRHRETDSLRPLFEREYPAIDLHLDAATPSQRYAWVVCDPDKGGVTEWLSQPMLWPEWTAYDGVFLLTSEQEKMARTAAMTSLSASRMATPQLQLLSQQEPQRLSVAPDRATPGKTQSGKTTKRKRSYRPLWSLLAGLAVGLALGFLAADTLTSSEARPTTSPTATDTLGTAADTLSTDSLVVMPTEPSSPTDTIDTFTLQNPSTI